MEDRSSLSADNQTSPGIVLWWLPVGAGAPTRLPQVASQTWERVQACREKREAKQLVHAALEVFADGQRFVIEMGPEWSDTHIPHKGVVMQGPVGLSALGRSRFFRYEVRCWADGELSDRTWAVGGPVRVSQDEDAARAILGSIQGVPVLTWGRAVQPTGDMWNSNSLVSWLLATGGFDVAALNPPDNGRAPGWEAGIFIARHGYNEQG